MLSLNNKISIRQMQILLVLDIFGTGVIVLPRKVAGITGNDGWLSVLTATAAVLVCVFFITQLAGKFKEKSFVDYSCEILSKPLGIIVGLLFMVRIFCHAVVELRLFGEIVRQTMLHNTPFWILCAVMLVISAYTAAKGYETRARIAELLIAIIFIPLLLVFLMGINSVDFSNLLPLLKSDARSYAAGGYEAMFSFTGAELLLLAFPYLNRPEKAGRGAAGAVLAVGLFMTAITALTIARFGAGIVQQQMWPVLEMADTVDVPGAFVERMGVVVMSFWIISVFAIVNAGLFFSSLILRDVVKKGTHTVYIIIAAVIIFAVTMLLGSMDTADEFARVINNILGIAFMFFIPFFMLIIAKVRGLGR